jgi:hypothetical protein
MPALTALMGKMMTMAPPIRVGATMMTLPMMGMIMAVAAEMMVVEMTVVVATMMAVAGETTAAVATMVAETMAVVGVMIELP